MERGRARHAPAAMLAHASLACASALVLAAAPASAEDWQDKLRRMERQGRAAAAHQVAAMQVAQAPAYRFAIAAKPLPQAIAELSAVTGVQVLYTAEQPFGRMAQPVVGTYTVPEALGLMLRGTGLAYRFLRAAAVTLEPIPVAPSGAVAIPGVTVEGREGVGSYRARSATTATKTDTPIAKVPASVNVVPRAVIDDQQALRIDEALRNVPGAVYVNGGEGSTFFSRGFSASLYEDGALRTEFTDGDGYATDFDAYKVERIEVFKGPASVLYGRGNPGGAINIVTKRPRTTPAYEGRLTFGSNSLFRQQVDLTGPLDREKQFAYRLNVVNETADSFRDEVSSRRLQVAPAFQWSPQGGTTIILDGEVADLRQTPDVGIPRAGNGPLPGVPTSRFLGEPTDEYRSRKHQVRLRLDHDFSDTTNIRSSVFWSRTRNDDWYTRGAALQADGRTLNRTIIDSAFEFEDLGAQADLTHKTTIAGMEHSFLLGLEAGQRKTVSIFDSAAASPIDVFAPVYGNNQPTAAFSRFRQDAERWLAGVYLQDQIALTDQLTLVLGGRLDYVEQKRTSAGAAIPDKSDTAFSPRAGIVWQPIQPLSLYATYARSFTPVNGFPLTVDGQILEAETADLYEAGVKLELFEGRLATTLAAYRIERSNVNTADLANPGFQVSEGEQESKGIELSIQGELVPGWKVIGAYAYTDARITRANNNTQGKRPAGIPEHSASLWSTYEFRDGPLAGLGFGGGLVYVDDRFGSAANDFTVGGYTRVDATVYYRGEGYTLRASVNNIFDKEYYLNPTRAPFLMPGAPRTFLVSLQANF
ncbi:MAG: TonB-dependent siderophore receptor [Alphaproteobacteria bacterium]